jgi:type I restriction enzyme M protein
MANERKTENIVRKYLTECGYFKDTNIIVEEQKSDFVLIDKLLINASKKGTGKGYPEFIYGQKSTRTLLLLLNAKQTPKNTRV